MKDNVLKTCSCGHKYFEIPETGTRTLEDYDLLAGTYWECENCKSTLFLPLEGLGL